MTGENVPTWRWVAPPVLLPAGLVGLATGVALGWRYLTAGYPLLGLRTVADELLTAFQGAVVFLLLFLLLERFTGRWLHRTPRPVTPMFLAALAAATPLVAAAGLRLNRALGIRPAELGTLRGLIPNALLLAATFLLVTIGVLWLRRAKPERMDGPWRLVAAGLLLAVLALGGSRMAFSATEAKERRPDVIVLLIDALRTDHLSGSGYPRETTPALDALAADGVRFTQAVASSTFTKTSIASLFTGRHPYQHGVYWGSLVRADGSVSADVLTGRETTLAEALGDQGYLTAAWVQNSHLQEVMGFGQGFVDYHDNQGDIERIHRRFRRFLDGPGRRYPFFAYLHYIDLHDPYKPAPPYDTLFGKREDGGDVYEGVDLAEWGRYLQAVRSGEVVPSEADLEQLRVLYDGQLRYVDDQIGAMLEDLKRRGLYDDAVIVVTSDHGDAFYEHGFISHSTAPYDELVRVPLLIKLPGGRFGGVEVDRQVRLIDLFPTVLSAAGGTVNWEADESRTVPAGCALQPLIRQAATGTAPSEADDPWDPACGLAVTEIAEGDPEGPPTLGLRVGGMKYIRFADPDRPPELYDLRADAGERSDLAAERTDDVTRLGALAERFDELREEARKGREDQVNLDAATIRELKALGYL